ncbi:MULTISPECIES: hypothetical protein [unclassified Pseudomonas]|uniref:hypothetical protein n=1 Tax=unclassified Pseudomonas TaxID=196821 RepID=UPI0011AF6BAD|nr:MULTISPECIES: hypothetical protein [unclassified Pseudomonas]
MSKLFFVCVTMKLFIFQNALANDPYVDISTTTCREEEDVYISCAFNSGSDQYSYGGEVASICAKSNTSPDDGYVQYRYGTPTYGNKSEKIKMQYPEKKLPPKGIFTIYKSNNPESAGIALRFKSGAYVYSFENVGILNYRVVVRKHETIVFDKACTLPGKNYLIDKAYIGIQHIEFDQKKISATHK